MKKQFSALSSLGITVNTYEDLPAASAEVGKLLTKVNTGMKTIERAQQKVESGKVSLASALDTLNANASMTALQVSASSTELANAPPPWRAHRVNWMKPKIRHMIPQI